MEDHEQERDIPLAVKYETKPIWPEVRATFNVDATGAAVMVAAFEAYFTGRPVSYSRNKNFYGPHRHHLITYKQVLTAVDRLAAAGWIHHYKQAPGARGWQSSFEATPELIDVMHEILAHKPRLRLARLQSATILRDDKGKPMAYRVTRELERQDRRTQRFNAIITAARIELPGQNVTSLSGLACPMARIYNLTFNRGGRFYAMGPSWQNIPKELRATITISGEPVVELDFDGMHISMLYAEAKLPLPRDVYAIDGWPRKLVKVATFTLINAKNESSARFSIANSDLMAKLAEPGSQDAIAKAAALIKAIKRKHEPIRDQLHSDAGARLMRLDSIIAESVMAVMLEDKGIVTVPLHDSFICPASKHDELHEAMVSAAYEVMGQYLTVSEATLK